MSLRIPAKLFESLNRNGPAKTASILAEMAYRGPWFTITSRYPMGTNVYERDWDLLLILDACRIDALREVAAEFTFIDTVDSMWSIGSTSHEWMAQTFQTNRLDEIRNTIYLTGNGFAQRTFIDRELPFRPVNPLVFSGFSTVNESDFQLLKGVWSDGHDDRLGNVPPRYITDRAISLGREESADSLIVHYNQPHTPYIADAIASGDTPADFESDPFALLQAGRVSRSVVWNAYLDNLRLVLGDVGTLLENIDAERVAITADHGEAFGEWGQYGHPNATPNPVVKKVPWVVTSATDTGSHTPADEDTRDGSGTDIEDHLADLGYIE